jgi:predicted transcriptional regulator
MFGKLLNFVFLACRHRRTSQPFAAAAAARSSNGMWEAVASSSRHYVVCLDCGKKFDYDWKEMRIVS